MLATDLDLAALIQREHPVLVGAVGLYLGDQQDAEDIAQEALVRLVQRWPLPGVDSPGAWVMRVAFNLATSRHRRRAVHARAVARLAVRPAEEPVDPGDALAVRRAVLALPNRQRAAIVLRYFADLSVRETATHLGCPEGTVKTLVHQGIKNLRAAGLEVTADD